MFPTCEAVMLEESDGLDLSGRAQQVRDVGYTVDDQIHDAVLGMTDEQQFHFLKSFQDEAATKLALASAKAQRIAEVNSKLEFSANVDGLRMESSMPLEVFNFWFAKGVTELGGNPWSDDEFIAEFLRDNPECRVKETSKNIVVTNAFDFRNRKEAA